MLEVFDDLTNQQLKAIIRQYNHHLKIVYSKLNRDELLKIIHKHFDIDERQGKIQLKRIEPIYFDVPEKKTYKRVVKPKPKKYQMINYDELNKSVDDQLDSVNKKYQQVKQEQDDIYILPKKIGILKFKKLLKKLPVIQNFEREISNLRHNKQWIEEHTFPGNKMKQNELFQKKKSLILGENWDNYKKKALEYYYNYEALYQYLLKNVTKFKQDKNYDKFLDKLDNVNHSTIAIPSIIKLIDNMKIK